MDQVKFVENSLQKIWSDIVCLGRLSSTNFTWSILEYFDPNDVISLPDRKKIKRTWRSLPTSLKNNLDRYKRLIDRFHKIVITGTTSRFSKTRLFAFWHEFPMQHNFSNFNVYLPVFRRNFLNALLIHGKLVTMMTLGFSFFGHLSG